MTRRAMTRRAMTRRAMTRRAMTCFLVWACLLLTAASTAVRAYDPPPSPRATYNFNPGWKLLVGDPAGAEAEGFNDSAWKDVTLPHAWNEDEAFRKGIADLPTGIAWYRKHFQLPAGGERKAFLEFEGVRQAGEFYLNGRFVGRHENGVMAFGFDISPFVRPAPQENVLAVRIDNGWHYTEKATGSGFQWNNTNFYANYGGINKNVFLHLTGRLHQTLPLYSNLGTTGVYVYAQDFDIPGGSAKITAEAQVANEYPDAKTFHYRAVIADMDGKAVQTLDGGDYTLAPGEKRTVSAAAVVPGLHFWSWGYGCLYSVYTILEVDGQPADVVKTRTGFRKTEFSHGVLTLNDRVLHLKGYAQRTTNEWPAVGLSVPPWMSDFSNRMIVEGNGSLVRWMHVTPWKQDVESLDRVGLMESLPAGDAEGDVKGRRWDQRLEVMRDAIIYDRNDPSVVFYEAGNSPVTEAHMQQMKDLRDAWDPHGGRAAGSRNMQGSKVAEYGGEMLYINKSAGKPMWQMEYSRDESLRKWWDALTPPFHKDGPPYNRNQDTQAIENVVRWHDYWNARPGTGTRVNGGGVKIIFSDSNTHFRGAQSYRRSGAVDAVRLPKDAWFADQVMWDGWVNVEHPRAYILGHWNYAPGTIKDVSVVSSADRVQLFVGGKSQGYGARSSRFLFTFKKVRWLPGTLRAVGYDAAGKVLCVTQKRTAGPPVALRLTPRTGPSGLRADGADLALVDVEVIDSKGDRCPTALNTVSFALTGPAEWRGGIAQDDARPDNYILSKTLPVQAGVNRVILRAGREAGTITLRATARGLSPGSVTLVSHPATVTGGLSLGMPDAGLGSYLGRGPTPAGASFTPSRRPVVITGVSAGSNADKAALSFDDDESTSWSSDGSRANAWIQYQFGGPETVSQVEMKMGAWRRRSYPVQVTVDGRLVYSGLTPPSLGYVTLSFAPVMGRSLKIELAGDASSKDTFGVISELNAKRDSAATGGDARAASAKGTLSIVEAEIYGPVGGRIDP